MSNGLDKQTATARHVRFAQEYVKDLDPYRAALRAGYMAPGLTVDAIKTIARALLKKPAVVELIQLEQDRITSRNEGLTDEIIDELKAIALFDVRKTFDSEGKPKSIADLDDMTAKAIQGIDISMNCETQVTTIKFRANDKIKALELLGKITGIIRPDNKINLNINGTQPGTEPERHVVIFTKNSGKKDSIETIEPITSTD